LYTISSTLLLTNDYPFLKISPDYISSYIFEVHKVDNKHFIKVLFSNSFKDEWNELHLKSFGCESIECSFDSFELYFIFKMKKFNEKFYS
jgi:hypothetical protein